ncbi:MAG: CDP-diacylglycerol--glycerol-3-phosphate 3-phosphatidyltransferase [Bacillota bacterium]
MNLPNRLTVLRVLMIPIFMVLLFINYSYGEYLAAAVFILAAITDAVDGHLARSRGMETRLGKFMDPIADKLLISSALISLVGLGRIPAWVAMVIIGREFVITGLRAVAAGDGIIIQASGLGKLKTIVQDTAVVGILIHGFPFNLIGFPIAEILLYTAVVLTIVSGAEYILREQKLLKGN